MTDLSKIADPAVRAALDAFQKGDKAGWLAAFAPDAELTDDGNPRSFFKFHVGAGGKFERLDIGQAG